MPATPSPARKSRAHFSHIFREPSLCHIPYRYIPSTSLLVPTVPTVPTVHTYTPTHLSPPQSNMDLMSDIGNADQLTSAREENKILKAAVADLKEKLKDLALSHTQQVNDLILSNAQLLAEVEMYRRDAALPSFSNLALGTGTGAGTSAMTDDDDHDANANAAGDRFVSSGNGKYPSDPAVTLPNLHGISNPLCCALNKSDTVLGTGGADSYVSIVAWGTALAPNPGTHGDAASETVAKAAKVHCTAPVICISFSESATTSNVLAAGCMDGSVHLIGYHIVLGRVEAWLLNITSATKIKFGKYVKSLAWSPYADVLASASADGTVQISKITLVAAADEDDDDDEDEDEAMEGSEDSSKGVVVDQIKSLHLSGAVEAVCFVNDGDTLCLFERETFYLSYFDLKDECKMTKFSLNGGEYFVICVSFIYTKTVCVHACVHACMHS